MEGIIKIVQALENQGILVGGVTKAIKNDIENQSGNIIVDMILGTLDPFLFGNLLSGSGLYRPGHGITRSGHGITRSGYGITRSGSGITRSGQEITRSGHENKEEIKTSSNVTTSFNKYGHNKLLQK